MSIKIPKEKSRRSKISLKPEGVVKNKKPHPADTSNYKEGEFRLINLEDINPDPNQPREFFDEESLNELCESIRQEGVLQPVIVRIDDNNKIWLVAGERRFKASQMAGVKKMPAVITVKKNYKEIALIENIQRDNLLPIEEAEGYQRLMDEYGYTQEELSKKIGKNRTTITRVLSLNRLPGKIKSECAHAHISKRILVEIAQKKDPNEQVELFELAKAGKISSQHIRNYKKKINVPPRPNILIALERIGGLQKTLTKLINEKINPSESDLLSSNISELEKILLEIKNKISS